MCRNFFALLLLLLSEASHAQWGDLKLQFVVEGDVPPPGELPVNKEQEICLKDGKKLFNESLIVGKKGELANVVVWLEEPEKKVPVHDDYAAQAEAKVTWKISGCRFEPRVVAVRTTQTLLFENLDPTGHNPRVALSQNQSDLVSSLIASSSRMRLNFKKSEPLPVPVACSIHPWMSASVLIQDHPYVAISDEKGKIHLKNIPAGEWTFHIWHERAGNLREATLNGKLWKWPKGRMTAKIADEEVLDLGKAVLTLEQVKVK